MKPKLLIVYITLITLPLVILGWLGVRAIAQEREMLDRNVQTLLADQLSIYDDTVQALLYSWTEEWRLIDWNPDNAEEVRERLSRDGRIEHFFRVGRDGILAYPLNDSQTTVREREFLFRSKPVWSSGAIHLNQLQNLDESSQSMGRNSRTSKISKVSDSAQGQWHEWYWGDGLQLLFWWPTESGEIYGVEINRVRLLAEIIGELPDTPAHKGGQVVGTRFLNASGHLLYQWGDITPDFENLPKARIPLNAPLGAWSFEAYLTGVGNGIGGNSFLLGLGLACLGLILAGLGIYFYRENTRELREASQRVNFVNHVSHELKTPLTNIRMYAELLQNDIEPERESQLGRLDVILSESQRLSRLITNVLTFNRKQKSTLKLHPSPVNLNELVRQVVGYFEKSFVQHGITIRLEGSIDEVNIDADVVEQILGNLLSNVEKYARVSGELLIELKEVKSTIEIIVQDGGPGIPTSEQEAIFSAFYRVEDALTEGVSGTGIGLSIARDLARLHGGDIELLPSDSGARFRVRLAIQGNAQ